MLIQSNEPSTFPRELKDLVVTYIESLSQNIINDIQNYKIEYSSDVFCAIEKHLGLYRADALYEQILEILESVDFEVFHASKVLSANDFEGGLKTNEWTAYSNMMCKTLKKLGATTADIETAKSLIEKEYQRKYTNLDLDPSLCFFSDISLARSENQVGYDQFCENIGGELARWALRDKMPEIYNLLCCNGIPVIVKFILPFRDVVDFHKEKLAYQFIAYYSAQYFWNMPFHIEFDSITTKEVDLNNILEIIKYTKEVQLDE